jgi:CTP synthase
MRAIVFMPEINRAQMGGTMRLGSRPTLIKSRESIASKLYGRVSKVDERHRHRYEVNPAIVPRLEQAGLRFIGHDETQTRMEIVELPESSHRFYFSVQFHPEFKSRPGRPSPPFLGLVLAASGLALPE